MDKLLESFLSQAPTVFVMLWIFSQLRQDVMVFVSALMRLLENCYGEADNDGTKGKDGPD